MSCKAFLYTVLSFIRHQTWLIQWFRLLKNDKNYGGKLCFTFFQVNKRPSIDTILADPIVLRRNCKLERVERRNSAGSTGADSLNSLKEELRLKEKKLEMKEKELKSIFLIFDLSMILFFGYLNTENIKCMWNLFSAVINFVWSIL